ncbi:MAG: ferritin-like domain-containing protein [Candidatus Bathyarchaeota archaeon]|nr:ferritin-like domain-containing protein [Candidatus Bathyarchaeota archaeon]
MGKSRLITFLNDLVAVELAAVAEYQQHAYLTDDPLMIDLMEDFSMEEMSHIEWCSREVARLGGVPTTVPKKLKPAGKTREELIKRDIDVEAEAMRRLEKYIKIADEEGEERIKKLLQKIYTDEEGHHERLCEILNPPRTVALKIKRFTDIGAGLILMGMFWLYLWLFPHLSSYLSDPRWAHNFAFPIILITIGVAYKAKKLSSSLVAALSAFLIIPTEAGAISGIQSTYVALILLIIMAVLILIEKGRKQELLFSHHRWRNWLKIHFLTLAFLFLLHMPFIYWVSRAFFGEPMEVNLPPEPPWDPMHWGTALFNILIIPFGLFGMAERLRGSFRRKLRVSKLAYWWALMITILGILLLGMSSSAWNIYGLPLAVTIAILLISLWAYKRAPVCEV